MNELADHVEAAKRSTYFSGARLATDLGDFLGRRAAEAEALGRSRGGTARLYLVGGGGSLATLATAKILFDRLTTIPTETLGGHDLTWREPNGLDGDATVVFASYSGETEDTVEAFRLARARGSRTVALVNTVDSTLGREADLAIPWESAAIFEAPLAALALAAAAVGGPRPEEAEAIRASVLAAPAAIAAAVAAEAERAEAKARRFLDSRHLYVLGSGALAPLAYKVALTVVMENIRIGGTFCDAMEFRHGPAEALERTPMDAMVLLGTDESRRVTQGTLDFLEGRGARTLVYDAAEYGEIHPLLTPLVLNSVTQWFVVYSAILRGITDLDARVFMGHGVLTDAPWP